MLEIKAPELIEETKVVYLNNGQEVNKGDVLIRLEGEKGNTTIKAPKKATIKEVFVKMNETVLSHQVLFHLEEIEVEGSAEIYCPDFKEEGEIKVLKLNPKNYVEEGEFIIEVEIEKGNHRINAPQSGQLKIHVQKEEIITIGKHIATITSGERVEEDIKEKENDVLVIGGGPGGYVAAIYAAMHGLKVVLVEKEKLGGTCLNVGCIPTKALVKASEVFDEAKHANHFGIDIKEVTVDINKMMDRKEEVVKTLVKGVEFLMAKNDISVIQGEASFKDAHTIIVNEKEYTAKDIIIATGSKISKIPLPGLDLPFVLDSTKALSFRKLPETMTIIGGGVIGMEFAFMYANLGVKVRIIEFADRLLSMIDEEASLEILKIAKDKGIEVHLKSKVTLIEGEDHAIIHYEHDGTLHQVESDYVLYAIGREPNLDGLNIEKTGVEMNRKAIAVDESMKTSVDHLYAIGDVTNIIQLAHVASEQGIVAVENILGHSKKADYKAVPNVIFTDPEIACVGLMSQDLTSKEDYSISKFYFNGNGKALTMNKNIGFVKLIKENKTNKVVGATIIGPDASSLINTLTLAIQNEMSVDCIIETIFPHPTTGEAIHEAALGLTIGSIHA